MPLERDVQLAVALLQATGLIIPVIFIALRPYYADALGGPRRVTRRTVGSDEDTEVETRVNDNTPVVVDAGLLALGLLALSTLLSSAKLGFSTDDLFVKGAVLAFWVGILMLFLVMALIRTEFLTYEDIL